MKDLHQVLSQKQSDIERVRRGRLATPSIESSDRFVASAVVSIATRWSEPVPGRELHPLKSSAFHGALFRQLSFLDEANFRRLIDLPYLCPDISAQMTADHFPLPNRRETRLWRHMLAAH